MLSAAENRRLTQVSKGTPGGDLMRRYWHPVLTVDELAANPVQTVKILGEELVVYRDRSGGLGLVGPRCAHRRVHLELGIPDTDGLRCPYHGWCFNASGACIDTPLEPENRKLREQATIPAYPVEELGGLIFAYLGPEPVPVLPRWDYLVWPDSVRQIAVVTLACNWLQCHENSGDPLHNIYLHGHFFKYQLERAGLIDERVLDEETHRVFTSMKQGDGFARIVIEVDHFGMHKGLQYEPLAEGEVGRIDWFPYNVFPYYSRATGGVRSQVNIRVPLDDVTTRQYTYLLYHVPGVVPPQQERVPSFEVPTRDAGGNRVLDFVHAQDLAAWEAQGPITDRTQEHLGASDRGVLEFRKLLKQQLQRVAEGADPINVFREEAEVIELSPPIAETLISQSREMAVARYRDQYHLGYFEDDIDRYGPSSVMDVVKALMSEAASRAGAAT